MSEQQLEMKLVYDVSHNIAKVERYSINGEGMRDLVIHRKGATRAFPAGMHEIPAKYRENRAACNYSRIYGNCKLDSYR